MVRAAPLIALTVLSGCGNDIAEQICSPLPPRYVRMLPTADEQKSISESCVDSWAARLSYGPDAAPVIVDGAISACSDAIGGWMALKAKEAGSVPAIDVEQFNKSLREKALFRVTQWRAGKCKLTTDVDIGAKPSPAK